MPKIPSLKGLLILFCLCFFISACTPAVTLHGSFPDEERVQKLRIGGTRTPEVQQILGSPSSVSVFDDGSHWFYISQKKETVAFLPPRLLQQVVLATAFDAQGTLRSVNAYTFKDGVLVTPVDRRTPTTGRELTILEQLIGNLNRLRPGGGPGSAE